MSALAVATWFTEGLKGFDKFYSGPKEPPKKTRSEIWRDECKALGLKAGGLTDEQINSPATPSS